MKIKNANGRPPKMNMKIMVKLVDAIQHNSNITEACNYAGISRDTFYRYLNNEPLFAEKIRAAKENQNKLVMSFLTVW